MVWGIWLVGAVPWSVQGAETCYSFAFAKLAGYVQAVWVRLTCHKKDKKRWGTQAAVKKRATILQYPNVLCFFTLLVGVIYALYLFFTEEFNTPWEIMPCIVMGLYLIGSLLPVVRMTIQEWLGWSLDSLHDKGHMSSAIVLAVPSCPPCLLYWPMSRIENACSLTTSILACCP